MAKRVFDWLLSTLFDLFELVIFLLFWGACALLWLRMASWLWDVSEWLVNRF